MSTPARSPFTTASLRETSVPTAGSPGCGGSLCCSPSCDGRSPPERAPRARRSTPAAADAWQPSSSPACRWTGQTRSACSATARPRWRRPLGSRRRGPSPTTLVDLRCPSRSVGGERLIEPATRIRSPASPVGWDDMPARRVAIVTGAARGIGAATVLALAGQGWSVLAVDLASDDPALPYPMATEAELSGTLDRARHAAGADDVAGYRADVRDQAAIATAVAEAEARWGGLDAAIAAAGVIAGGVPLWEVPLEQEQAVLDVDLGGVISLARAALPALLRRPEPRSGRFLAVASSAATRGIPMLAAYCAAKAGVAGLVRALGAELGGTGVTANAVSPGSVATPMLDESARLYGLPDARSFAAQQPERRLLEPAEVAAVIAFLAGPDSSAMTGAVVPVDGGLAL